MSPSAEPIGVASTDPAEILRATQEIADALERTIAAAPDQWYSFKPMWPATAAESGRRSRRGPRGWPRPRSGPAPAARWPRPGEATGRGRRSRQRHAVRRRAVSAASWLACRLPERPLARAGRPGRRALVPARRPTRAAQARRNLQRVARWLVEADLADARVRAAARDPQALDRLVRAAFRHYARYYLDVARAPALDARLPRERLTVETPEPFEAAFGRRGRGSSSASTSGRSSCRPTSRAVHAERPLTTPMETVDDPALQAYFARTGRARHPHRGPARGPPGADGGARAGRAGRARRRP